MSVVGSVESFVSWPKVALHDHLDGGLRPETLFELADNDRFCGFGFTSPQELARSIAASANSGSLVRYLEPFRFSTAVLGSADNLFRVASEAALDLAFDGVCYAELRFAPLLHVFDGLPVDEVVSAVLAGVGDGERVAAAAGFPLTVNVICVAMRNSSDVPLTVEVAQRWLGRGVAGFDLAGAEDGFPPGLFSDGFDRLCRAGVPVTIHSGEAAGVGYVADALRCGARRLGHGTALASDVVVIEPFGRPADTDGSGRQAPGRVPDGAEFMLGSVASEVRDRGVLLEVCPTSNVQTAAVASFERHPIDVFAAAGLAVSVSCDNRLMSSVSLSSEYARLSEVFGWGRVEFGRSNVAAMRAAFCDGATRNRVISEVLGPFYGPLLVP